MAYFPSNTCSDPYSVEYSERSLQVSEFFPSSTLFFKVPPYWSPRPPVKSAGQLGSTSIPLPTLQSGRFFLPLRGHSSSFSGVQYCENYCLIYFDCLFVSCFSSDDKFRLLNGSRSLQTLDFNVLLTLYCWLWGRIQCTDEEHGCQSQTNWLTSLCLPILICKMGVIIVVPQQVFFFF